MPAGGGQGKKGSDAVPRLAPAYLAEARKNAEFRAAIEECRREIAAAAGKD